MNDIKVKYQEYKARYEQNAKDITTYETRVQDGCGRINEYLKRLKSLTADSDELSDILNKAKDIPECDESNLRVVAQQVKTLYSELESYCIMTLNSIDYN